MKNYFLDTATQFPAVIVYTVDGSSEGSDLDPIIFMRDEGREDSVYEGLLIEAQRMSNHIAEGLL